jgi:hypothetical protein
MEGKVFPGARKPPVEYRATVYCAAGPSGRILSV